MFKLKVVAMAVSSLAFFATVTYADVSSGRIALLSPGLQLVSQAELVGPINHDIPIEFKVWLKMRNKQLFNQKLKDIYDPNSPYYHQFLSKEQIEDQFAPTKEIEAKVLRYFTDRGMQAKIINHHIHVKTSVKQAEQVFQVTINQYRYENRLVYANTTAPTLDESIAQHVLEVSGLSNIIDNKPGIQAPQNILDFKQPVHDLQFIWKNFVPNAQPTTQTLNGITGSQLQTAYQLTNIPQINNTTIDGSGQTIVIIDACDTDSPSTIQNNANLYNSANGISPLSSANFTVVNPDGTPYTTCGTSGNTGWNTEIALDVESAHTIAPGAKIVLVLSDSSNHLDAAEISVINVLINNSHTIGGFSNAYVVSNSWGRIELNSGSVDPALENSFASAALNGISVQFSSGDCGDNNYTSGACSNHGLHVDYPAASANITAIGGSSLFTDNSSNYAFETGWGTYISGFYFGSGGGVSQQIAQPSWQTPIQGFIAGGYGTVGTVHRAVPDIGMLADPYTGLIIYTGGSSFAEGGTSLACPLFSATLALVNQARALIHSAQTPIGQAAPMLYNSINTLQMHQALNLIIPPHQIIAGTLPNPLGAPLSSFTLFTGAQNVTFSWDSSLTIEPEDQFWNDVVGVGSPNIPNFVSTVANL